MFNYEAVKYFSKHFNSPPILLQRQLEIPVGDVPTEVSYNANIFVRQLIFAGEYCNTLGCLFLCNVIDKGGHPKYNKRVLDGLSCGKGCILKQFL